MSRVRTQNSAGWIDEGPRSVPPGGDLGHVHPQLASRQTEWWDVDERRMYGLGHDSLAAKGGNIRSPEERRR